MTFNNAFNSSNNYAGIYSHNSTMTFNNAVNSIENTSYSIYTLGSQKLHLMILLLLTMVVLVSMLAIQK